MVSLSNIIFENINEDFGYGMIGSFKVIIKKSNSFVNASKLCKDGGKKFNDWSRLKSSEDLIEKLENRVCGDSRTPAIIEILNVDNDIKGSYVNQYLIFNIAQWISSEYSLLVCDIMFEYTVSEYKKQLENKDRHIDSLCYNVVVKAEDRRKRHHFHLISFGNSRYKVIRGQKNNITRQYKFIDDKNIEYTTIMELDDIPNGVKYGNRLKERIGIKFSSDMTFILPSHYDESLLKCILTELHQERFFQ